MRAVTMRPVGDEERRSDVAWHLMMEFAEWYGRLGSTGKLPRAFSGVAADGKQAVVDLSNLPLDHVQRREFLIWLCREERMHAYVYGTHVGASDGRTVDEQLLLYASSPRFDMSSVFAIERDQQGRIAYRAIHGDAVEAGSADSSPIFHGLQRNDEAISEEAARLYAKIWGTLKQLCMWRYRNQ
ncbi:hypothetical protein EN813_047525 [Mesorhizobium sp. M00.F.Ca.ET.170.01.1.1]|nr:hypothetical protein EN813_047525 [Mesorhizobium sp. M00.F.Ca.ET.170.01.1.1]